MSRRSSCRRTSSPRAKANLKTLADLRGKTVVCAAGTNTLARVNGLNHQKSLSMTIVTGKDHAESLLMVEVTLDFPLSAPLRKALGKPTDSPDPATYE